MAKFLIKIEKEDINTCKLGDNIMISLSDNFDIIFTPEAIQELFNDFIELEKPIEPDNTKLG